MTEELTVDVPLVAVGESSAIANDGGTLLHAIESVRIKALPDHLPQAIEGWKRAAALDPEDLRAPYALALGCAHQ